MRVEVGAVIGITPPRRQPIGEQRGVNARIADNAGGGIPDVVLAATRLVDGVITIAGAGGQRQQEYGCCQGSFHQDKHIIDARNGH
jgi:hypothetical protein